MYRGRRTPVRPRGADLSEVRTTSPSVHLFWATATSGHPRSAAEGGVLNQGGYRTGRRRDAAETSTTTWSTFRNIQGSGLDRRCVALFLARKSINGTRKRMSAAPTTRERVLLLTITFPKPASRPTTARPRYTQDGRGTWLDRRVIPKKSLHRRTSRFHWRESFIAFAPD